MPKKQNQRQPAKSRKMPKSQPIQDYDEEEEEEYEEDQEEEEDELEDNSFINNEEEELDEGKGNIAMYRNIDEKYLKTEIKKKRPK